MKITKGVIPAAGLGTRLLPATIASPKEMLVVVDKPVIQYVVEEAAGAGIEDLLIITGRTKRAIEDHFDFPPELEDILKKNAKKAELKEVKRISELANLHFIRQKRPLGLGDAVLKAHSYIGNQYFAVLLGDTILDQPNNLSEMLKIHRRFKASVVALEKVPKDRISRYGVAKIKKKISSRLFELEGLVEKPKKEKAPSDLAVGGRYILSPKIFEILKNLPPSVGGEIQITDGIQKLIEKGEKVIGYIVSGGRFDIGSRFAMLEASLELALQRKELKAELKKLLKRLN